MAERIITTEELKTDNLSSREQIIDIGGKLVYIELPPNLDYNDIPSWGQILDAITNGTIQPSYPDGLVAGGSVDISNFDVGIISVNAAIWKITVAGTQNQYSTTGPTSFSGISLCSTGMQRYIAFYGTTSNTIIKVESAEDIDPVFPDTPSDSINISHALITDTEIQTPIISISGLAQLNGGNIFTGIQNFKDDIIVNHGRFGSIRLSGHYQGEPEVQRFRIAAYRPDSNNVYFTRIVDPNSAYPNDLEWDYDTGIFDFKKNPTVNGVPIGGGSGLPTLTLNTLTELYNYINTFTPPQLALNIPYKGNGAYLYITQDDIDEAYNPFTFIVKTDNTGSGAGSSNNNQFKLPLTSGKTYDFTVDWGDGNTSVITAWNQAEVLHTYSVAGTYTIECSGTISDFNFIQAGSDKNKILEVLRWGDLKHGGSTSFYGCINLNIPNVVDTLNLEGVTNLSSFFRNCTNLSSVNNLDNWNVSNVTDMRYLFYYSPLFNESIGNWDMSSVTDIEGMFAGSTNFNQPIGDWNVSNVINMSTLFEEATSFNQPIGDWDVSNVINMFAIFSFATSFNQPIGNWNVSNVTNMSSMFTEATSFNHPIGDWNVSNVTNFTFFMEGKTALNYNATYLSEIYTKWSAIVPNRTIIITFETIKYNSSGSAGRATLISKGWTITDGGLI